MPPEVPATAIRARLHQARMDLLGGRGPGASEEEVAAHTRNRKVIAGVTATRRLELAARDTAQARRETDALTDTIELSRAELADTITQLTERLSPRHLPRVAVHTLRARFNAHPAAFLFCGAALVLLVQGRRRPRLRR